MDQVFSFYNNLISGFSRSAQGIISLVVAGAIIYFAYSLIKKHLIWFILILVILFPIVWPALIKIWADLVLIIKFLISR